MDLPSNEDLCSVEQKDHVRLLETVLMRASVLWREDQPSVPEAVCVGVPVRESWEQGDQEQRMKKRTQQEVQNEESLASHH